MDRHVYAGELCRLSHGQPLRLGDEEDQGAYQDQHQVVYRPLTLRLGRIQKAIARGLSGESTGDRVL